MTTDGPRSTNELGSNATVARDVRRREFVAAGAGIGATLLAGCAGDTGVTSSGDSDGSDGSDGSDDEGSGTAAGRFRLLISDAPADIDDFERLDVTVESARIFEAREEEDEADDEEDIGDEDTDDEAEDDEEGDEDEDGGGNETADDDGDAPVDGDDDAADDDESENDDSEGGFTVIDLGGVTVDLTQVLEEDAMPVFDGELAEGRYEKLELNVASAAGTVDGEAVAVKLPSEKLQITKPFEVRADETVSFVFDINVVKRGPNNGYILKPVISGSGVAGRDVEVNEVGEGRDDEDDGDEDADDAGEDADDDVADDEGDEDGDGGSDDESVADGDDDGPDGTDATGDGTNTTDGDDGSGTGS